MGRLVGLPHFMSEAAFIEEKNDAADIRRTKRDQAEEFDALTFEDNPLTKLAQVKIALRIQEQFEDRVIRRTIDSLNWKGEPLINLPPYTTIMIHLDVTEREMQVIAILAEQVRER